jgi:hypothetical protein
VHRWSYSALKYRPRIHSDTMTSASTAMTPA